MPTTNDYFYAELPVHRNALPQVLMQPSLFHAVPADWFVIITDIKNSTEAVYSGNHETVNLVATGSIVSVLNIAYKDNIVVPFFFGGDGATFIVPPLLVQKVIPALLLYKENTKKVYGLELRIGTVPVEQIYAKGHQLNITKFSFSDFFPIPIVLGNGLNYAEQVIKGEDYLLSGHDDAEAELNLNGMECRWDKIPPPENREEVVTLLVVALDATQQAIVFSRIMQYIDDIYGVPQHRQPISVAKLKLTTTFNKMGRATRAILGKINWFTRLKEWITSHLGFIYFKTKNGKQYLRRLVDMSDTLVIDGKINTVISGNEKQRSALENVLNNLEAAGEIWYGMHISSSSVMSCYVRDLKDGHVHFVDGAEGGYTKAAGMLKKKLKK